MPETLSHTTPQHPAAHRGNPEPDVTATKTAEAVFADLHAAGASRSAAARAERRLRALGMSAAEAHRLVLAALLTALMDS